MRGSRAGWCWNIFLGWEHFRNPKGRYGTSLVVQRLRIHLPMQGTRVGSLVREDTTSFWFSCSVVSDSLRSHGLQYTRPPCPSPTPGAHSNSCPSSQGCHPVISSSVVPFTSYLQSFPASGSFPKSQFFASGGQSIGVSASASVLPMTIQDWFPLGWTSWISLHTCRWAAKPKRCKYWAHALEPVLHNKRSHCVSSPSTATGE